MGGKFHQQVQSGELLNKGFTAEQGLLHFNHGLYILLSSPIKQELLHESHDSLLGGHGALTLISTLISLTSFFFYLSSLMPLSSSSPSLSFFFLSFHLTRSISLLPSLSLNFLSIIFSLKHTKKGHHLKCWWLCLDLCWRR
ncbi:hypothetical protein CFOL_v3_00656 [Cephalotus follicularis]|uniref:Uncharacterized protein n=1 Tax=Cephalotus follicularis TaxID=3775 RepID=A0A1Q3AN10_CEPFO|nr:hypothetical protein CFOL_v3_00656 [Cephalotus follicularis]